MNRLRFVQELLDKGIELVLHAPNRGASMSSFRNDPREVLEYLENPDAYYAKLHGVSLREYLLWTEDNYSVVCSATTAKGKPCKQIVTGGSFVSVKQWVEMQGEYCRFHGGE